MRAVVSRSFSKTYYRYLAMENINTSVKSRWWDCHQKNNCYWIWWECGSAICCSEIYMRCQSQFWAQHNRTHPGVFKTRQSNQNVCEREISWLFLLFWGVILKGSEVKYLLRRLLKSKGDFAFPSEQIRKFAALTSHLINITHKVHNLLCLQRRNLPNIWHC